VEEAVVVVPVPERAAGLLALAAAVSVVEAPFLEAAVERVAGAASSAAIEVPCLTPRARPRSAP